MDNSNNQPTSALGLSELTFCESYNQGEFKDNLPVYHVKLVDDSKPKECIYCHLPGFSTKKRDAQRYFKDAIPKIGDTEIAWLIYHYDDYFCRKKTHIKQVSFHKPISFAPDFSASEKKHFTYRFMDYVADQCILHRIPIGDVSKGTVVTRKSILEIIDRWCALKNSQIGIMDISTSSVVYITKFYLGSQDSSTCIIYAIFDVTNDTLIYVSSSVFTILKVCKHLNKNVCVKVLTEYPNDDNIKKISNQIFGRIPKRTNESAKHLLIDHLASYLETQHCTENIIRNLTTSFYSQFHRTLSEESNLFLESHPDADWAYDLTCNALDTDNKDVFLTYLHIFEEHFHYNIDDLKNDPELLFGSPLPLNVPTLPTEFGQKLEILRMICRGKAAKIPKIFVAQLLFGIEPEYTDIERTIETLGAPIIVKESVYAGISVSKIIDFFNKTSET